MTPSTSFYPEVSSSRFISILGFERNRNEVIYTYQKNRNPFIDHPEFVAKIFEHDDYKNLSLDIEDNNYHQIYYFDERRRLELWV